MKKKYPIYYYKDFYDLFLDKTPRIELLKNPRDLNDDEFVELQNFIGEHQKVLCWSTNIDVIEAAQLLVEGAKDNMNLGPDGIIEEDEC
jgi:hypothetical protein